MRLLSLDTGLGHPRAANNTLYLQIEDSEGDRWQCGQPVNVHGSLMSVDIEDMDSDRRTLYVINWMTGNTILQLVCATDTLVFMM